MMGGGMMGGRMTDAEAKKQLTTLTRTDFLLQFVWQPVKQADLPKTEEDRAAKIKDWVDKLTEVEKNHPAVTMPKAEEIEAASNKKSKEIDSQLEKALTPGAAPGAPGVGGTPGVPAGVGQNPGATPPPAQ
jgi:type IV pilus assembly protein PilM